MADHSTRISQIQAILRAGARRVTVDGVAVEHDFAALRRELRQLMAEDERYRGRRPVVSSIDLSGYP